MEARQPHSGLLVMVLAAKWPVQLLLLQGEVRLSE